MLSVYSLQAVNKHITHSDSHVTGQMFPRYGSNVPTLRVHGSHVTGPVPPRGAVPAPQLVHLGANWGQSPIKPGQNPIEPGQSPIEPGQSLNEPGQSPIELGQAPLEPG